MITFRVTTEVKDNRQVVLTLPPDVPTGQAELEVTVSSESPEKNQPQAGIADWVEVEAKRDGAGKDRYPLRGSVVRYEQPTEPVAEADWEALQ